MNKAPLLQVLARVDPRNILSISRVKVNSMVPTAPPKEALEHRRRGRMPMNRYIKLDHTPSGFSDSLELALQH